MSTVDKARLEEASTQSDEMDWDAYAEHYDEMCALNPAYTANIDLLLERMASWPLPASPSICDLGAGTGNYILSMAEKYPSAQFWHVDIDRRMVEVAKQKYAKRSVENLTIVQTDVHDVSFEEESFDVVLCINSLYAFDARELMLKRIRRWLKPDGRLFLIDFGRKQRTLDWTFYIFRESMKAHQLGRYAKALVEARELLKQNRKTTKGQESGRYWLHTTEEFGESLRGAGYKVEELSRCYRNYCDLAVCRKAT
ncbi:MAG: methyltransferase domain-containing protein [Gammaproteobacteria bacterium]|nr:methyltransferase domain-containing protein [Gammaproteobacteria bacterium]